MICCVMLCTLDFIRGVMYLQRYRVFFQLQKIKSESTVEVFNGECLQCRVNLDISTLSSLYLTVKPHPNQGLY